MTSIVSPDYVWNLGDVLIWLVAYIWFHQYYAGDKKSKLSKTQLYLLAQLEITKKKIKKIIL